MDLLHPKIVHLPIALALLVPLLAAVVWIASERELLPRRAWWLVIAAQFLLVVSGIAAMQSGERDEHRVEAWVPEPALESHEHAAKRFMAGAFVVLLLSAGVPWARRKGVSRGLSAASLTGMAGVVFLGVQVGSAGGALVYEHGAAQQPSASTPSGALSAKKHAEHDDD